MRNFTLLFFLFPFLLSAQQVSQPYGEEFVFSSTGCLHPQERAKIQDSIAANIQMLKNAGKIPQTYSQSQVLLAWPMQLRSGLNQYGYHSISGQVDQNPAFPNQLLDYNCGTRTYDTPSGYNHAGTDYFLWPFAFNKMDSSDVEIIAAAAGTIVYKQDGQYDRSCTSNSNQWNAVYVQHSDGSVAWYGHMKNGSLTTKTVGQTVAAGEYLGVVGSSGNSTGPHLHLEIYDASNNLIDPYSGSCNSMNTSSWWISQRPYVDGAINHIVTNNHPPVFSSCPNQDLKNEHNYFTATDTIFLMLYYRFLSPGDAAVYTIYRPDNSVWGSWTYTHNGPSYNAAWYYYWMIAGAGAPSGMWRYEVSYNNQTYYTNFYLGLTETAETGHRESAFVFYNAESDWLQVQLNESPVTGAYSILVFDMAGRQVHSAALNAQNNQLAFAFPSGVYTYAVLKNGEHIHAGKLVVTE